MHGIEVVNLAPFIIIGVLSSEWDESFSYHELRGNM
jgi:hypothetical protein